MSSNAKPPVYREGVYKFSVKEEPESRVSGKGNTYLMFTLEVVGYFDSETGAIVTELDGQNIAGFEFSYAATWLTDGRNIGLQQLHDGILPEPLPALEQLEINPETKIPNEIKYAGLTFFASAESEEKVQKDDRTGKPQINPLTGKPVVTHQRRIVRILNRN